MGCESRQARGYQGSEAFAVYLAGWHRPEVIHGMCEDYRAGATVDFALDTLDHGTRLIESPIWRDWATDVRGRSLDCGHFLPEELPDDTARELAAFFR